MDMIKEFYDTKYLEDNGCNLWGGFSEEAKERVQTRWIYLKKGQKVFFKVFDMTDKDTNKRKLAGRNTGFFK